MSNYTLNKKTNYMAISAAAILVTAFVLVQPMQARSQEVIFEGIPDFNQCFLKTHPDLPRNTEQAYPYSSKNVNITDPISMNTVVAKTGTGPSASKIAKTVHAEKELFECRTVQGNIPIIVDVTTYVELYANMTFNGTPPEDDGFENTFEVITCVKVEQEARFIGCEAERDGQFEIPGIIVQNCKEDPIDEPQEMNTVAYASINGQLNNGRGGIVLTVEAQKEIFLCDLDGATSPTSTTCNNLLGLPNRGPSGSTTCRDDDKKVDVIVFTEIWENVNRLPGNPVLAKDITSLTCLVKIETALVEVCEFTLPDRIVG